MLNEFRSGGIAGAAVGTWIALGCWLIEAVPKWKKAAAWCGGLSLLGAGLSTFLFAIALYCFSVEALGVLGAATASQIYASLSRMFSNSGSSAALAPEVLVRAAFLNPTVDYLVVLGDGSVTGFAGAVRDSDRESIRAATVSSGGILPVSGKQRVSPRRSVAWKRLCPEPGCQTLGLGVPSELADDILHRATARMLYPQILGLLLVSFLLLVFFSSRWGRLLDRKMQILQSGIAHFRDGNYGRKIDLSEDLEFGAISDSLDRLAERIPLLESEVQYRRNRLKDFLLWSAAVVRTASRDLRPGEFESLARSATQIRDVIELVFELAEIEYASRQIPTEEFSLSELMEEETASHEGAYGRSLRRAGCGENDPCLVLGPSRLVVRLIRFFARDAEVSQGKTRNAVILEKRAGEYALVFLSTSAPNDVRYSLFPTVMLGGMFSGIGGSFAESAVSGGSRSYTIVLPAISR